MRDAQRISRHAYKALHLSVPVESGPRSSSLAQTHPTIYRGFPVRLNSSCSIQLLSPSGQYAGRLLRCDTSAGTLGSGLHQLMANTMLVCDCENKLIQKYCFFGVEILRPSLDSWEELRKQGTTTAVVVLRAPRIQNLASR